MHVSISPKQIRAVMILLLLLLGIGSVLYTQFLIVNLREKDRNDVELWAKALQYVTLPQNVDIRNEVDVMARDILADSTISLSRRARWARIAENASADLGNPAFDFVYSELILESRIEIPAIRVDENDSVLFSNNVDVDLITPELIASFKSLNTPIEIIVGAEDPENQQIQYIYYGESGTIQALRYFPYVQFGVLALFMGLAYSSWSSTRRTEQSNLWVGMAREAAHQLGTPLTSLYGWITLLKESDLSKGDLQIVHELSDDVERLQSVADRFSKIGSAPELRDLRAGNIIENVANYMERRFPQMNHNVVMIRDIETDVRLMLNQELFQWALENLIKNALDAIDPHQSGASLAIHSRREEKELIIDIEDTGKGIEKRRFKEVFKPGYSTKKRGWGLGLSLTKRIIEEYHGGKVFVLRSTLGKGTTFRIILPIK
jgi:signal transduction histidine kinase